VVSLIASWGGARQIASDLIVRGPRRGPRRRLGKGSNPPWLWWAAQGPRGDSTVNWGLFVPVVTVRARRGPAVPDAVRT